MSDTTKEAPLYSETERWTAAEDRLNEYRITYRDHRSGRRSTVNVFGISELERDSETGEWWVRARQSVQFELMFKLDLIEKIESVER